MLPLYNGLSNLRFANHMCFLSLSDAARVLFIKLKFTCYIIMNFNFLGIHLREIIKLSKIYLLTFWFLVLLYLSMWPTNLNMSATPAKLA